MTCLVLRQWEQKAGPLWFFLALLLLEQNLHVLESTISGYLSVCLHVWKRKGHEEEIYWLLLKYGHRYPFSAVFWLSFCPAFAFFFFWKCLLSPMWMGMWYPARIRVTCEWSSFAQLTLCQHEWKRHFPLSSFKELNKGAPFLCSHIDALYGQPQSSSEWDPFKVNPQTTTQTCKCRWEWTAEKWEQQIMKE